MNTNLVSFILFLFRHRGYVSGEGAPAYEGGVWMVFELSSLKYFNKVLSSIMYYPPVP